MTLEGTGMVQNVQGLTEYSEELVHILPYGQEKTNTKYSREQTDLGGMGGVGTGMRKNKTGQLGWN